ncbi:MAG: hypothetical protein IGS03_01405 [Candidatus Sericytochromatia bacterium]|nr:hypothetical protein [Candidatus Sericytochromatia bacterium]
MSKHLLTIGLSFLTAALLSACEVPNTPNDDNNEPTPAASASPSNSDTASNADANAGVSTGQPTQAQFVAAMQCFAAALTEDNQPSAARTYQQQAQIVAGWSAETWTSMGLMEGSAQLGAYARAQEYGCKG